MYNLKGKKVYVTGGSGFLGQRIVEKLLDRGAVIEAPGRYKVNLQDIGEVCMFIGEFKPDLIIHSAAYYGGIMINKTSPEEVYYRNTIMGANILHASKLVPLEATPKVVVVGTACCYPGRVEGDMEEHSIWDGACHDSVENYGCVKKMLWIQQRAAFNEFGMNGAHVILTNLYGEHDSYNPERSHVVAALIRKFVEAKMNDEKVVKVWGTGRPVREFLYVDDAAEAIVRTAELANSEPELLNIGTGIGTSIEELTRIIAEIVEFDGELEYEKDKPDGAMRKVLDIKKMVTKLNWQPPTGLREGLEKTITWYRTNRELANKKW